MDHSPSNIALRRALLLVIGAVLSSAAPDAAANGHEMGCEGLECGIADDGMGGMIDCGLCPGDEDCIDGFCVPLCVPAPSCEGAICGSIDDGCGGTLFCGTCPAGKTCDEGVCIDACVPATSCGAVVCGTLADGCGGTLACGTCQDGCMHRERLGTGL